MYFRSLLSALLTASINLSLCTGGVLSSVTVFAAEVPTQEQEMSAFTESIPMSFSLLQYMSCSVDEESDTSVRTSTSGGCADRETCLQQSHDQSTQRVVSDTGSVHTECYSTSTIEIIQIDTNDDTYVQARDGPLFEDAENFVHSVQKRE